MSETCCYGEISHSCRTLDRMNRKTMERDIFKIPAISIYFDPITLHKNGMVYSCPDRCHQPGHIQPLCKGPPQQDPPVFPCRVFLPCCYPDLCAFNPLCRHSTPWAGSLSGSCSNGDHQYCGNNSFLPGTFDH